MKVIFLDIDGVLNNLTSMYLATLGHHPAGNIAMMTMDAGCVLLFKHLVVKTGAKFVVTSTWRRNSKENSTEVFNALRWCGFDNAMDHCAGITIRLDNGNRGMEIDHWLKIKSHEFGEIENYVILDDDSFDIHQGNNLVKTVGEIGLTVKDLEKAFEILGEEMA